MRVFLAWAMILSLAGLVLGACGDTEDERQGNDQLMASLPLYPGATLVQKYETSDVTGPFLWHVYATSVEDEAVLAFYQQELAEQGWQEVEGKDSVMLVFHKDGAEADLFLWGQQPSGPGVKVTEVASPPPGTVSFFGIRVSQ